MIAPMTSVDAWDFAAAARRAATADVHPLDRLRAIGQLRRALPVVEEAAVRAARTEQISWAMIALYMGVSHQAVIKRWRKRLYGDAYDPMSSRLRPDRLPPRGPAPARMTFWSVPPGL